MVEWDQGVGTESRGERQRRATRDADARTGPFIVSSVRGKILVCTTGPEMSRYL
jgi:hypothetical protein